MLDSIHHMKLKLLKYGIKVLPLFCKVIMDVIMLR